MRIPEKVRMNPAVLVESSLISQCKNFHSLKWLINLQNLFSTLVNNMYCKQAYSPARIKDVCIFYFVIKLESRDPRCGISRSMIDILSCETGSI